MNKLPLVFVFLSLAAMIPTCSLYANQAPASDPQQNPAAKPDAAPAATTQSAPSTAAAKTSTPKPKQTTKSATPAPLTLKTQRDKVSYALGMSLGTNLYRQSVEVDPAIVLRGLKDALAAGKTSLTEQEAQAVLAQLQTEVRAKMQAKQQEAMRVAAEPNKKAGQEFLTANKAKEGVVVLPDGLQYKILTEGAGAKPAATDVVVCNYRGTLLNGKEFDSSYKRNQPLTIPVNGVIKGWSEALQLMPVGSKWQLFIPSDLAYGDRGMGQDITPGSTLIFEVELISIQAKDSKDTKDNKENKDTKP